MKNKHIQKPAERAYVESRQALAAIVKWLRVLSQVLPIGLEKLGIDPAEVHEVEIEVLRGGSDYCWITVGRRMVYVHESEVCS